MSDNVRILPEGYASIWVNILDADFKEWRFSYLDRGIDTIALIKNFITHFEYTYDEENDDACKITFQFDNLEQAKGAYIEKDTILVVKWGYTKTDGIVHTSPIRKVAIRNSEFHYTAKKVIMVLDCTDLFSYVRNFKINFVSDRDYFEEWLAEIVGGTFIATITTDRLVTMISTKIPEVIVFDKWKRSIVADKITEETTIIKGLNVYENILEGHSKAITAQIEALVQHAEDGPFYIEGRDGIINVFNRDFKQLPQATWTFKSGYGEMISFISKTNLKTEKLDESESATVNPETKEIDSTETNFVTPITKKKISEKEMRAAVALAKKVWEWNLRHPKNQRTFDGFTIKRSQIKPLPSIDQSKEKPVKDGIPVPQALYMRYDIIKISAKEIMSTPGYQRLVREAVADNYILKKLERRYTATAIMLGDPDLITSRVYEFLNLMPHEEGPWYCSKCEHKLNMNRGYITKMSLLRNSDDLGIIRKRKKSKIEKKILPPEGTVPVPPGEEEEKITVNEQLNIDWSKRTTRRKLGSLVRSLKRYPDLPADSALVQYKEDWKEQILLNRQIKIIFENFQKRHDSIHETDDWEEKVLFRETRTSTRRLDSEIDLKDPGDDKN